MNICLELWWGCLYLYIFYEIWKVTVTCLEKTHVTASTKQKQPHPERCGCR